MAAVKKPETTPAVESQDVETQKATEDTSTPATHDMGTLHEQPTVQREPVKTELEDGTLRVDY